MRIGVLINERAGNGGRAERTLAWLAPSLSGHKVMAVPGYGAELLPNAASLSPPPALPFRERLLAAACGLLSEGPDLMIVSGGDGLAAYVAEAMLSLPPPHPPLLGVAMGTANVGPVISVFPDKHSPPDLSGMIRAKVGAVEALCNGVHIAYAMNDIVLTDTLLATVDGRMATVGAAEMIVSGAKAEKQPMAAVAKDLRVEKNGHAVPQAMSGPAQIVVAPLERDRLYGRAVYGAPCLSPFLKEKAALALLPAPLVSMSPGDAGLASFLPVFHLLFGPEDSILLSGLLPGAHVIADGNPYAMPGAPLTLRYCPDLIPIATDPAACR